MMENEIKEATLEDAIYCAKAMACIEVCEECRFYGLCHTWCDDVYRIIIQALQEIQEYKAIGTVEQLQFMKSVCDMSDDMMKSLADSVRARMKYEAIGTVEEFKALKEKNEQKKPEVNEFDYGEGYVCGECESFLHYVDDDDEHIRTNYCCHCGTKIDWQ